MCEVVCQDMPSQVVRRNPHPLVGLTLLVMLLGRGGGGWGGAGGWLFPRKGHARNQHGHSKISMRKTVMRYRTFRIMRGHLKDKNDQN